MADPVCNRIEYCVHAARKRNIIANEHCVNIEKGIMRRRYS